VLVPYVQQVTWAGVVLQVGVGAFVLGELTQVWRGRRAATRADVVAEALFRVMFVGGILMFPVGRAVAPDAVVPGGVWGFGLGVLLGWLGLLLRWWSFVTLGTSFTLVVRASEGQRVVDSGPYRVLRHPSYSGLLLAFLGAGLMLGNWVGTAAALAVLAVALVYRIRKEERVLGTALGSAYRDFAAGRARLIPYVW
jgi:protein-S-isoprenylcysteine O-methyltransferase Ste14